MLSYSMVAGIQGQMSHKRVGRSYIAFSNLALAIRHDCFHCILLDSRKGLPSFKVCACVGVKTLPLDGI